MKPAEMSAYQRTADPRQTRAVLVRRLARLIRLQGELHEDLNSTGYEMLDRAIYSTYRDCLDLGAEAQAQALMARYSTLARREGGGPVDAVG